MISSKFNEYIELCVLISFQARQSLVSFGDIDFLPGPNKLVQRELNIAKDLVRFFYEECSIGLLTDAKSCARKFISILGVFSVDMLATAVKPTSIIFESKGRSKLNQIAGGNASRIVAILNKKVVSPLVECVLLEVFSPQ